MGDEVLSGTRSTEGSDGRPTRGSPVHLSSRGAVYIRVDTRSGRSRTGGGSRPRTTGRGTPRGRLHRTSRHVQMSSTTRTESYTRPERSGGGLVHKSSAGDSSRVPSVPGPPRSPPTPVPAGKRRNTESTTEETGTQDPWVRTGRTTDEGPNGRWGFLGVVGFPPPVTTLVGSTSQSRDPPSFRDSRGKETPGVEWGTTVGVVRIRRDPGP